MRKHENNIKKYQCFVLVMMVLLIFTIWEISPLGVITGNLSVKAATVVSNPRIETDNSMVAGQKTTWDCVYFGSYPQSEVTSQAGNVYKVLKKASGWNKNNDIVINKVKYHRLKGNDATYVEKSNEKGYYNWKKNYTSYHYFKYEPIKWRVLHVENGEAILLADKVLDEQMYNPQLFVGWKKSTIRSWLNGYGSSVNQSRVDYSSKSFINTAFSTEQKNAINTLTKNGISDKISLLSGQEAGMKSYGFCRITEEDEDSMYDVSDEGRQSKCSTYAYAMGTYRRETATGWNVWWWINSPVGGGNYTTVEEEGRVYCPDGMDMDGASSGVRPVLHLNLSSKNVYSLAGTVCSADKESEEVCEPKVSRIYLTGISHQIAAGKKIILKATIEPKEVSDTSLLWKSSNKKIATVNTNGVVTLKRKTGGKTVVITATATDGSEVSAFYKITSMRGIVKRIKISGKRQIKAGKKLKLKAKVTATRKSNKKLRWISSNNKYAIVNTNGIVTTKKSARGKKVKITAIATDGSGKKATVTIKIR